MGTRAEGKTFMFTGRILVTRNLAQKRLVDAGGIPGNSVCSTTDYLVVGESPGSKLERAEHWGVPTITEEEFWEMLKEEQEEELPMEQWAENGIMIVPGDVFERVMLKLEEEEKRKKELERQELFEPKSWEDMRVLNALIEEYSDVIHMIDLTPQICPHCKFIIPYTIQPGYYYCFNCNCYTASYIGGFIWEKHKEMPEYDHGSWMKCKLTGKIKFVEKEELAKSNEFDRKRKLGHSVEFALPIRRECAIRQQSRRTGASILLTKTPEEIDKLYDTWQSQETRKAARRHDKLRKRYALT